MTVHIIPRIHKCVPGPLCNSLVELPLQTHFTHPQYSKKNLHFYTLIGKNSVYVSFYAGAYFAGLKKYDAYSFLAIFFVSLYSIIFAVLLLMAARF
jgi:hypothetical protein